MNGKRIYEPRIVIIGPSTRFLSGISYYTIRLSNALSMLFPVTSLLFRHMLPKRLFPGWRRVGDDLVSLKYAPNVKVKEILDWNNPFTWAYAAREVRRADVTIFEWWTSSVAHMYLSIQVLSLLRSQIIIEFHEVVDPLENSILPIRIYARVTGRLIRRYASRYIVHSNHDLVLIAENYRIPTCKISVIPHGLYDHYQVLDQESAKKELKITSLYCILFFGLLRPYKGVSTLIEAFSLLPDNIRDQTTLLIAGEGWEDTQSLNLAARSKYTDKIRIEDRYIPDSEIPFFFSAADLLALPYTRASQSGVAHIGISYGLPVVASNVGGLTESLAGYEGTSYVPPENPSELAQALTDTITKRLKRYSPPEEIRWERIAERYRSEIIDMLGER